VVQAPIAGANPAAGGANPAAGGANPAGNQAVAAPAPAPAQQPHQRRAGRRARRDAAAVAQAQDAASAGAQYGAGVGTAAGVAAGLAFGAAAGAAASAAGLTVGGVAAGAKAGAAMGAMGLGTVGFIGGASIGAAGASTPALGMPELGIEPTDNMATKVLKLQYFMIKETIGLLWDLFKELVGAGKREFGTGTYMGVAPTQGLMQSLLVILAVYVYINYIHGALQQTLPRFMDASVPSSPDDPNLIVPRNIRFHEALPPTPSLARDVRSRPWFGSNEIDIDLNAVMSDRTVQKILRGCQMGPDTQRISSQQLLFEVQTAVAPILKPEEIGILSKAIQDCMGYEVDYVASQKQVLKDSLGKIDKSISDQDLSLAIRNSRPFKLATDMMSQETLDGLWAIVKEMPWSKDRKIGDVKAAKDAYLIMSAQIKDQIEQQAYDDSSWPLAAFKRALKDLGAQPGPTPEEVTKWQPRKPRR
jgi:hypothetical protein